MGEHYNDSRETCHDSESITIVLNIIKSSVGIYALYIMCKYNNRYTLILLYLKAKSKVDISCRAE